MYGFQCVVFNNPRVASIRYNNSKFLLNILGIGQKSILQCRFICQFCFCPVSVPVIFPVLIQSPYTVP